MTKSSNDTPPKQLIVSSSSLTRMSFFDEDKGINSRLKTTISVEAKTRRIVSWHIALEPFVEV